MAIKFLGNSRWGRLLEINRTIEPHPATPDLPQRPALVQVVLNGLLLGAWVWLYLPVLAYLSILFSREEFRTNQIVLMAVAILIGLRLRDSGLKVNPAAAPRLQRPALALALIASLLYLLAERYLNINTLSAVLCGLASYGVLGLWMNPARWRAGFPAMLLAVGVLPFGEHIETFLGYPARIVTARLVGDGLRSAGFPSIGADTILVFESGISQVDLPCSGVKSLWTGMLFWLAATWIENRALNLRWLLSAALLGGMLMVANLVRVGLLVLVGEIAGLRQAAELIHVPLGVLGFVICCGMAVVLLRWQPAQRTAPPTPTPPVSRWLAPVLLGGVLGMALVYQPRPPEAPALNPGVVLNWQVPAQWTTEPAPMTPAELELITQGGAEATDRRRFHWNGLSGTLLLVTSRSWRAQHRPELCFEVYGFTIENSVTRLVTPDFPLKALALSADTATTRYAAVYWFQSKDRTTEDYSARMWADLQPQRARWVLVTVLLDAAPTPDDPALNVFYTSLHAALAGGLKEGATP